MSTQTQASVVWQDGSMETSIPSRSLYPIIHLDEQEFFCGDLVTCSGDDGTRVPLDEYGIVQGVDHANRTCHVKWFRTYKAAGESRPTELNLSEEAVYELRDHPDFKFR